MLAVSTHGTRRIENAYANTQTSPRLMIQVTSVSFGPQTAPAGESLKADACTTRVEESFGYGSEGGLQRLRRTIAIPLLSALRASMSLVNSDAVEEDDNSVEL